MSNYLPWLLILACPLMMIFMMRGMGGARSGRDMVAAPREPSEGKQPSENEAEASQRIADLERQVAELRPERDPPPRDPRGGVRYAAHAVGARSRTEILMRLNQAPGQLAGISWMYADDRYCVDVVDRLSAVNAALDAVAALGRTGHLKAGVQSGIESGDSDEQVAELVTAVRRYIESR